MTSLTQQPDWDENSPRWFTGLVVGKFRPFHQGHRYLIDAAVKRSRFLTVFVVSSPDDDIDANIRALWIHQAFPSDRMEVKVIPGIPTDDTTDESHKLWADYTKAILGYAPDVVFTSEKYGDGWAQALGAIHCLVDLDRKRFSVSGTDIRNDPVKYERFLDVRARADYIPRVVVAGAESTGKTTLAKSLGAHYNTEVVPEFGRLVQEEAIARGEKIPEDGWSDELFWTISRAQTAWEQRAAGLANHVLICDTDSLSTATWYYRYTDNDVMNSTYFALRHEGLKDAKKHALYIVTSPHDFGWEDDGTRDPNGGDQRHWMHIKIMEDILVSGVKYVVVSGNKQGRLEQATAAIDKLVDSPVLV